MVPARPHAKTPVHAGVPPPPVEGLGDEEVAARIADGRVNATSSRTSRSLADILRENVLTRFNAILGALFVVVLVVGPLQDALFGAVLAVNTAVGIAQEVRARQTLERLRLLSAPLVRAIRSGERRELPSEAVVVDDVLELRSGDQVVADGTVLSASGLEVDESLLTGESVPAQKRPGDEVLSGSAVLAGHGTVRVVRVGDEAFAQRVERDARRFDLVRSELRAAVGRILQVISWAMVPLGMLVVTSQLLRSHQSLGDAVRGSVAAVGAMVPEGLVLLTTIAFAAGALRLARRRVLVNELAAVEGLARVDVLCIDKTGTLTEPGLHLTEVAGAGASLASEALGAMAAADPAPNATMLAARESLPSPGWRPVSWVPFSSERKWSAMEFEDRGTWVLGAPDAVLRQGGGADARRAAEVAASGRRVLVVARSSEHLGDGALPGSLVSVGWAVFEERLRPDAAATVAYLSAQGVRVIVLSGDDPRTVSAVARRAGVAEVELALHADELPGDPRALGATLEGVPAVGRVQPYHKRDIVRALQARGHVVAMTGDGVNDIPALKAADLGLAMGTGAPAARAVARVVLLDGSFDVVPQVLDEGRRVIANIERVARLFITKTAYATLLALVVGIAAVPYPFYPRHFTLVSSLTIGVPGFLLAFAPGAPRARPGLLERVLRFAVPAGAVAGAATLIAYVVARSAFGATGLAARTAATGVLLAVGLEVLVLVCRPLDSLRAAVVVSMAVAAALAWLVHPARILFGLQAPPAGAVLAGAAIALAAMPVLAAATGLAGRRTPSRKGLSPLRGRRG